MAHLIVRNDPRLALLPHLPESHGPEFVAVMLDLAETLYGSVERDRLKDLYRTEGAQMLAEQPPRQRPPPRTRNRSSCPLRRPRLSADPAARPQPFSGPP